MRTYLFRGNPKRVLRDDGSDYFSEPNLSENPQKYRDRLRRFERLEKLQLEGCSDSNMKDRKRKTYRPSYDVSK